MRLTLATQLCCHLTASGPVYRLHGSLLLQEDQGPPPLQLDSGT